MHPDLLRALAKARHEDLLYGRPIEQPRARSGTCAAPRFSRSRRRMGLVLIWAGARLMGDRRPVLDLAHD
jgi:hypothetical protein